MTAPVIDGLTDLVEVGRGGFGIVFRATDRAHARTVAVKVLRESLDADGVARFERECRAAGSLSGHPNIVTCHGSGFTAAGAPYLVMDLLPGGSLGERVAGRGPLAAEEAIALGIGMAGALSAAHARGIVHRDVKPENILYSSFGVPQLVDFGIARMASEFETRTGSVSASLAHAPPEVIAGAVPSPQGDVYSLASVLHFALAGGAPFSVAGEESLAPLLARISTATPPDLRSVGVPGALAEVVERGLAKDPSERPSSAAELAAGLAGAASSLGLAAPALVAAAADVPASAARWEQTPRRPAPGGSPEDLTVDRSSPAVPPAPAASPPRRGLRVVALGVVGLVLLAMAVWIAGRAGEDEGGAEGAGDASSTTVAGGPDSSVPGPPTDVVVADPVFLGAENSRVSITLRWKAPDGAEVTGYRIRSQQQHLEPCDGPNGEEDVVVEGEAIEVEVDASTVSSQYSDTEAVCGWVVWQVATVSDGGVSDWATATGIVPDVVGVASSFHLVRAVGGLASGTDPTDCREAAKIACSTSPSAGTRLDAGTLVAITLQS